MTAFLVLSSFVLFQFFWKFEGVEKSWYLFFGEEMHENLSLLFLKKNDPIFMILEEMIQKIAKILFKHTKSSQQESITKYPLLWLEDENREYFVDYRHWRLPTLDNLTQNQLGWSLDGLGFIFTPKKMNC